MTEIKPACFPGDLESVVAIFRDHVVSPSVDLGFQDYELEFASLPANMQPQKVACCLRGQAKPLLGVPHFVKLMKTPAK